MLAAVLVYRVGEGQIGVGKLGVDVSRSLHHLAGHCQQLLLLCAQDVRGVAADVEDVTAEALQSGFLGVEAIHCLIVNRHDLRRLKRSRGGIGHICGHCHSVHLLILGNAGILIVAARGIVQQIAQQNDALFHLLCIGQKRFRILAQRPGKSGKLGRQRLQLFQILRPGLVVGIQIFNRPAILLFDFLALQNFLRFSHVVTSFLAHSMVWVPCRYCTLLFGFRQ